MEDFRLKSICELGDWLKSERFSDKVVETFEGTRYYYYIYYTSAFNYYAQSIKV